VSALVKTGGPTKMDYQPARQTIMDAIGRDAVARLHRPIPALDAAVVVGLPALFATNAVLLATYSGWAWIPIFILQGLLIQIFGYAVHDLFVHRRVAGRAGYFIGALFELPLLFSRTWYARLHLGHHAAMNTHDDTEAYKQDIDSRLRRLVFLTMPGVLGLAWAFKKKPADARQPAPLAPIDAQVRRQLRVEAVLAVLWLVAIVVTLVRWWQLAVFGYLLPVAIVAPAASTIRVILEHAECDPDNVFHCATFYRTGLLTGPLFFWDAGDCHVVHHLYPAIPFYRMPAAVKAMAPVLIAHGARERRSLLDLLHGWFLRNETHRTIWSR
jgi:fatty acid desaturase